VSDVLRKLKAGSIDRLRDAGAAPPGIVLGARLAEDSGMVVPATVSVGTPELTPFGLRLTSRRFKVCGVFETGFFDIDDHWAYVSLPALQKAYSLPDVANQLELRVDDLNRAGEIAADVQKAVGPRFKTTTWMERNKPLLSALRTERIVTLVVIGLIELVAALNILITLVMMVMEKYRDIAVLMSMGARREQIRRIFMLQGVLIGAAGSAIGLALAYPLCFLAARYRWIPLDESIYGLAYVPFDTRWYDGVWVAAGAILISFLATIYPARAATRITPAEVLRYE
jgi:lipoprotein-releasing system permease protein